MPRGSKALRTRAATAATAGACGWNTGVAARAAAGAFSSVAWPVVSAPRTRARVDARRKPRRSSRRPNRADNDRLEPLEHPQRVRGRHRDAPDDGTRGERGRARERLPAVARGSRPRARRLRLATELVAQRARARFDGRGEALEPQQRCRARGLRRPRTRRAASATPRRAARGTRRVEPAATTSVRSSSGAGATRSVTSVSTASVPHEPASSFGRS